VVRVSLSPANLHNDSTPSAKALLAALGQGAVLSLESVLFDTSYIPTSASIQENDHGHSQPRFSSSSKVRSKVSKVVLADSSAKSCSPTGNVVHPRALTAVVLLTVVEYSDPRELAVFFVGLR